MPCALFSMLWKIRHELNPADELEEIVVKQREDNHLFGVEPISKFARTLKPRYWWVRVRRLSLSLSLSLSLVSSTPSPARLRLPEGGTRCTPCRVAWH